MKRGPVASPASAGLFFFARCAARSAQALLAVALVLVAFPARAETFDAAVIRIVDGDSLIVLAQRQEIRVRLKEIDAPESKQAFGKRSRQSLTQICEKKTARVSWTETDRNGRMLGRVWCDGIDANTEQVSRGMAWVSRPLRQGSQPIPAARRRAIRPARLVGRRHAGSTLGMATSEGCA
jgi:endonuclease YncB( thermonuclease family)